MSSSSKRYSTLTEVSETELSILRAFSHDSIMREMHLAFLRGFAPYLALNSLPNFSVNTQSKSRPPKFLSDLWQMTLVASEVKLAMEMVVLALPRSMNATFLSTLGSRSLFLKKPY